MNEERESFTHTTETRFHLISEEPHVPLIWGRIKSFEDERDLSHLPIVGNESKGFVGEEGLRDAGGEEDDWTSVSSEVRGGGKGVDLPRTTKGKKGRESARSEGSGKEE